MYLVDATALCDLFPQLTNVTLINSNFSCFSAGVRKTEKPEDKKSLVMGPMQNKKQEQTKFVVPQIFVDYGSRRQSYASDYLRRCSAESLSSRRTSFASNETDRRGSGSSLSSRRTSLASNDRRGSGSSLCSRRTSLLSDCTSRRSSGSSRSSRKGSNASSGRYEDTDELLAGTVLTGSMKHAKRRIFMIKKNFPYVKMRFFVRVSDPV